MSAHYARTGKTLTILFSLSLLLLALPVWAQTSTPVIVPTWRYDLTHSGLNSSETLLTPANVNATTFGKLFALPVDGLTYAQPLYVPGLTMSDGLVHNVLFVATSHDSVYAYDADSNGGANANPIWHINLLTPAYGAQAGETTVPYQDNGSPDVGENGVTGTPAINPATNTMYLVATSTLNGVYYSRLHAINIITGAEQANAPALISATVAGTGHGSTGGELSFDPLIQNQRSAVDYYNGYVYFGYAAHGDIGNWHGWLFAYNATTMQQTAALCLSPNGYGAGIWESGAGMPIDSLGPNGSGRMFLASGNGTFGTANTPTAEMAESVIQFNLANGALTPSDIFVAFNAQTLNDEDVDLGSGGVLMLPDELGNYPHELISVGKEGRITVLNRDDLGGFAGAGATSNTNALQDITGVLELPAGAPTTKPPGLWNTPAYWHGRVYMWGNENVPMIFAMVNGVLSTTPTSQATVTSHFPTPSFSISANGYNDGIAWALRNDQFNTDGPAVLYAWDATNLANLLYESDTNAARDSAGPANKNAIPIITNGKVYVATHGQVDVYGLFNGNQNAVAPVIAPNGGTFSTTQSVTLTTTTTTASIYYTLDGSVPTPGSTLYSGPISISTDTTVNAIASAPGFVQSGVSSATFTFTTQAPAVTFQPAAGTYNAGQQVTLADTDAAAIIHYTTDGSTPTAASTVFTGPISVSASQTINAIAIDPSLNASDIATAAYVILAGLQIDFANGFSTTTGLTFNGTTAVDDTRLQLTDGNLNEAGSVFWNTPVNIQAFTTNFTFQLSSPNPTQMANGFTFTIQNNAPTALGGDSAGLGYQGIPKSVAIKFNFYNYENEGSDSTGIYKDGEPPVNPTVDISSSGVILNSGDNINAQITYDGTTLTLTLTDPLLSKTFTYSWPINIPQFVVGNTAYVGFTGGAGGLSASQKLISWTYVTQALPPVFSVAPGTYTTVQNVILTSATPDAVIAYTTDGSTPGTASQTYQYSGPLAVAASETIKAIAVSPTVGTSMVESAAYVINLQTQTGTFSLSGTPPAAIMQGGTATSAITVAPSGGFTGNVALACAVTSSPAGATGTATCSVTQPAAITGTGSAMATLTVTTQATTSPGTYTVTVTGTSTSLVETTTVPVLVSSPTVTPSFTLTGTPVSVTAGTNGTSTITVAPSGGFLGSVALTCAVTGPAGASNPATCSAAQPAAIAGSASVTAALTVSTQQTTTAGSYTVTVTGTSGSLTQTATVTVTVAAYVPPPTPGFAVTGSSVTDAVPGTPATSTITITPTGGFAGSVALACSLTSYPAGATDMPTCSVTQPAAISGTSAVTATLTVSTTGSSTAAMHNPLPKIFGFGGGTMAVAVLFGVPFRRRKWHTMLGLLLLCAAFMGATGCGGVSSTTPPANGGTTAGAYTFTVTGTSGTISQTATVAVTVQ